MRDKIREHREEQNTKLILDCALKMAQKTSYLYVAIDPLSVLTGLSTHTIRKYVGPMHELQTKMLKRALKNPKRHARVIAQGVALGAITGAGKVRDRTLIPWA